MDARETKNALKNALRQRLHSAIKNAEGIEVLADSVGDLQLSASARQVSVVWTEALLKQIRQKTKASVGK